MAGIYELSLVVNDGLVDSDPATVTIVATSTQDDLTTFLQYSVDTINHYLNPANLKNTNMANALTNKLTAALDLIDQGLYADALDKLENDILKKTDGCATSGSPDRNDWIQDCDDQSLIYPLIMDAISLLKELP